MPLTEAQFAEGLSTPDYLDRVKANREAILTIYRTFEPPAEEVAFFDALEEPLKLAVFTEDWCGDAMTSTPSILKLADSTRGLEVRTFQRDQYRALTDSFLPPHRAGTLPVFVVSDQGMAEVARFIETAKELQPLVGRMSDELRARVLKPEEQHKPLPELSPEARAAFGSARAAYRAAHAQDWGEIVVRAFTRTVRAGLALPPSQRPAEGGTEWPPR